MGQYTQVDPIGLAGGNPTLYGYVFNPSTTIDLFGLTWDEIFRSMLENSGMPQIGDSARGLGVRPGVDIPVDANGMVRPGTGGMSVSPSPESLPPHRRPPGLGGTGKDSVWQMNTNNLGSDLRLVPDSPTHGTIQPSRKMTLAEYQNALNDTVGSWEKVPCR